MLLAFGIRSFCGLQKVFVFVNPVIYYRPVAPVYFNYRIDTLARGYVASQFLRINIVFSFHFNAFPFSVGVGYLGFMC